MPVSPNTLQAVFELYDDYTASMKKIIESQKEFEGRQKRADQSAVNFQSTLGKTEGKASSAAAGINQLVSKLAKIVTVTDLTKKGWDLMWESINTSAMQKMQETTFGALLNNRTAGSAVYNWAGGSGKGNDQFPDLFPQRRRAGADGKDDRTALRQRPDTGGGGCGVRSQGNSFGRHDVDAQPV